MINQTVEGTDKTYEELHREIWNWLADHPTKEKRDWFEKFYPNIEIEANCFACEYSRCLLMIFECQTRFCPLCQSCKCEENESDGCLGNLYWKWDGAEELKEKAALAKQIAELPWTWWEERDEI